jgi:hypothetical protein
MSELERQEDWITSFLRYTAHIPSPEIFRLWSAITALSGAMERRLWVTTAGAVLYPNLYTLLVSPPGVGKSQAINIVYSLWTQTPNINMAPDNVTKASLLDYLEGAKRQVVLSATQMVTYHSLVVSASEFGVFLPAHDTEFLSSLNHIYDNPDFYKETRRTTKKVLEITNPQLTILAGTQPAYLSTLLPEAAWGMGFMSRQLLIYSGTPVTVDLFSTPTMNKKHRDELTNEMTEVTKLYGAFSFTEQAKEKISAWNNTGREPVPAHGKLGHYNARRIIHLLKLCMISSVSRGSGRVIEERDFDRAFAWLIQAENNMGDIFRAMVLRSDTDVIQDLILYLWELFIKSGKKPIHEARIYTFLQAKVPAEKIAKIIETAEISGFIERDVTQASKYYTPKARSIQIH